MSLKNRILADLPRVFMNFNHFAEYHTWNGERFLCVLDDETALKRKNNNVVDISWENNTKETMVYTPIAGFPEPESVRPNEHIFFDNKPMKILQVQDDDGMYGILLVANNPKAVM